MTSDTTTAALDRLHESMVDGRAENGRYRQDQLQSLHQRLRDEAGPLCAALQADARSSPSSSPATTAESEAEFALTMQAVAHFYHAIDFAQELADEYRVAHGRDHAARRVGAGLVVLRPTSHTRLFSVVVPLAAAIAAGNCLVLELSDTLLQVDALLRTLLPSALSPNTFAIVKALPSSPEEHPALASALVVDQTNDKDTSTSTLPPPAPPRVNELRSATTSRCIAIVDRSADIEAAAQAIATARFRFGGTSPYAPDLVLVNEFVKTDFFEACSRHASLLFAGVTPTAATTMANGGSSSSSSSKRSGGGHREDEVKKAIQRAEESGQVSTFGSSEFKLVDVLDKTTPLMTTKITGRYLPIATCSSLTDALYNQDYSSSNSSTPLLAGYLFAEPESAKYLAQFLPSHISVLNQIPTHLLVGPAAPTTTPHPPDFLYRYHEAMFTVPRPQFVERIQEGAFSRVEEALLLVGGGSGGGASSGKKKKTTTTTAAAVSTTLAKLREVAVTPLPPTGQPDNKAIGFFEHGLLVGAGIYASLILPALGFSAYLLGKKGLELAARYRK